MDKLVLPQLRYTKGWEYRAEHDYWIQTPVVGHALVTDWYDLTCEGMLFIPRGFAWDGATWAPDYKCIISSMIHDAFCQMFKARLLDFDTWYVKVADFFRECCIAEGVSEFRADLYHQAVILGRGGDPAVPTDNPELIAP